MPQAFSRSAAWGDSRIWSMRMPLFALPGAEIIPEGVLAGFGMEGAEGVGVAQIFDPPQRRPGFGLEQRVLHPGFGIVARPCLRE